MIYSLEQLFAERQYKFNTSIICMYFIYFLNKPTRELQVLRKKKQQKNLSSIFITT